MPERRIRHAPRRCVHTPSIPHPTTFRGIKTTACTDAMHAHRAGLRPPARRATLSAQAIDRQASAFRRART
ncbi:hypothetical protein D7S86_03545 [Pararobbsia silviterrae]|uniref:Uncharacterized protein n=1 Tax=Pararobbsia silviterrae TaxID=1792498 RepID=A0A494YB67_9BURK|nr:hypothetical protein D7S86_03545 [Pararobbsia silviterrae]